ncbi:MAG: helix-turn-helix domain-containing protein [Treponema sp.]|nr:helix-turn-helix domain-containing protein [Treponema sp.]MCL2251456.1 helix-turn-helix domain-containing protein [Treponema sp.]
MYEWHRLIQIVVDEIDERIKSLPSLKSEDSLLDEALTLQSLSKKLGYSEFHTTRRFKEISGILLGDYIRLRKLAFAIIEVRDTKCRFLDIALKYGFGSHEAFTRAFKTAYGITPKNYRKNPLPVVLRTKISVFDRYFFGLGEIGMIKSTDDVKVYFITMPSHKFLHIKNYESSGYWDFWEKQEKIPGQDCNTICGLLDSIKGKLDGKDDVTGKYSGQIMAYIFESNGKKAESYGVRLPANYNGTIPENMLLIDVPEMEYIVFEHGPFNYEEESETVGLKLQEAIDTFDFSKTEYKPDTSKGRISYFYFVPESFEKRIQPVIKK